MTYQAILLGFFNRLYLKMAGTTQSLQNRSSFFGSKFKIVLPSSLFHAAVSKCISNLPDLPLKVPNTTLLGGVQKPRDSRRGRRGVSGGLK